MEFSFPWLHAPQTQLKRFTIEEASKHWNDKDNTSSLNDSYLEKVWKNFFLECG